MTTNMKDYFLEENEEEVRKVFEATTWGQFQNKWYNKLFSNQLESDETDTLEQRVKWWTVVVDRGRPIANDVYDYSFSEMFGSYRETIELGMRQLLNSVRDRRIIS